MEEKVPQDVIDKMSSIVEKIQEYINRYNEHINEASFISKVMLDSIRNLLKEISTLVRTYNIQEITRIDQKVPLDPPIFTIENASAICEEVVAFKFLNSLRNDRLSIAFDNKWKDRIRSYVLTIKSILDNANIENERLRNSIFSKLNAFSAELDKTKTSIQSFQDAFLEMSMVAGQIAENIKPAVSLGLKVMRAFGHLIDIAEHPQLPPPDDHKLLPHPDENEEDE